MTSIRETITSALTNAGVSAYQQNNYSTYIDAVVTAVEAQQGEGQQVDQAEQGYVIIENLVETAQGYGLGRGPYEEELVAKIEEVTGLTRRPAPEPEPELPSASDLEAEFASEDDTLTAILTAVREIQATQSEQGAAIEKLNGLAKSRLGVNL